MTPFYHPLQNSATSNRKWYKIFDTNEDSPQDLQEANARLATAAPELLESLHECARLLADYDESEGEEGQIYRRALAVIKQALPTIKTKKVSNL